MAEPKKEIQSKEAETKEEEPRAEPRLTATLEEFVAWYYSEEVAFTANSNLRPIIGNWLTAHGHPAPPFPLVQA